MNESKESCALKAAVKEARRRDAIAAAQQRPSVEQLLSDARSSFIYQLPKGSNIDSSLTAFNAALSGLLVELQLEREWSDKLLSLLVPRKTTDNSNTQENESED